MNIPYEFIGFLIALETLVIIWDYFFPADDNKKNKWKWPKLIVSTRFQNRIKRLSKISACIDFGHKHLNGEEFLGGRDAYFTITHIVLDGIGRYHAYLEAKCLRCGKNFRVGMVHLPKDFRKILDKTNS